MIWTPLPVSGTASGRFSRFSNASENSAIYVKLVNIQHRMRTFNSGRKQALVEPPLRGNRRAPDNDLLAALILLASADNHSIRANQVIRKTAL